jgi:hypothetical protein
MNLGSLRERPSWHFIGTDAHEAKMNEADKEDLYYASSYDVHTDYSNYVGSEPARSGYVQDILKPNQNGESNENKSLAEILDIIKDLEESHSTQLLGGYFTYLSYHLRSPSLSIFFQRTP